MAKIQQQMKKNSRKNVLELNYLVEHIVDYHRRQSLKNKNEISTMYICLSLRKKRKRKRKRDAQTRRRRKN